MADAKAHAAQRKRLLLVLVALFLVVTIASRPETMADALRDFLEAVWNFLSEAFERIKLFFDELVNPSEEPAAP
jgi:hypothetical protein